MNLRSQRGRGAVCEGVTPRPSLPLCLCQTATIISATTAPGESRDTSQQGRGAVCEGVTPRPPLPLCLCQAATIISARRAPAIQRTSDELTQPRGPRDGMRGGASAPFPSSVTRPRLLLKFHKNIKKRITKNGNFLRLTVYGRIYVRKYVYTYPSIYTYMYV